MEDDRFEWDDTKAAINLAKHGVSFEAAKLALADRAALIEPDPSVPSEERWRTTGMASGKFLFVVTTEPRAHTIRIISARTASRHEQARYLRQAYT